MRKGKATQAETAEWYTTYYQEKGGARNDLLVNPEVDFQSFASEWSIIQGPRTLRCDRTQTCILDVGCGSGGSLILFLRLGFVPENMIGVDILATRVTQAQRRFPNIRFHQEDAAQMSFPDAAFDIVHESTMFIQITDADVATAIARETVRVTKRGGHILLTDWRYNRPGHTAYCAVSPKRIAALFQCGVATTVQQSINGALIPPVGRFFSKRMPGLYFLTQSLCPILVGQTTTVLRKN